MADIVRRLVVEGKTTGMAAVTSEVTGVAASLKTAGAAGVQASAGIDKAGRSGLNVAGQLHKLRMSLDETYRSELKLKDAVKVLDQALQQSNSANKAIILTEAEHSRMLDLVKQKYDAATIAATKNAAATLAAANANRQFQSMNIAGAQAPRGAITGGRGFQSSGGGAAPPGMPPVDVIGPMSAVGGPALAKQQADQDFIRKMSGDMRGLGQQTKLTSFEVTNLGMQFNDIAVMAASGQNPMVLIMQQGMQLAQILAMSSVATLGLKATLVALGASVGQFLTNPLYLAVAAAAALAAAIMFFGRTFRTEVVPLEDVLKNHKNTIDAVADSYKKAGLAVEDFGKQSAKVAAERQRQAAEDLRIGLKAKAEEVLSPAVLGTAGLAMQAGRGDQFRMLQEAADVIRGSTPDFIKFQEILTDIRNRHPGDTFIDDMTRKLLDMTDAAVEAQQRLAMLMAGTEEREGRAPRSGTAGTGEIARRQQNAADEAWAAVNAHYAELDAIRAITDAERLAAVEARARAEALKDRIIWPQEELEILRAIELEQARIDVEHRKEAEQEAKRRADEVAREAKRLADEKQREAEQREELLATARFEVSILNETEEQQAVLNALRELGADATADQRAELEALTRTQFQYNKAIDDWEEKTKEAIGRMDEFRSSAKGILSGFLEEGWKGAADALASRLMGLGEDLVITGLFGAEGKAGGGIFGDLVQSLIGPIGEKPVAQMNVVAGVVYVTGAAPAGGVVPGGMGALPGGMGAGGPGQIDAAASAIRTIKSGSAAGNYGAMGPVTASGDRAYGAYQVMGANVGPWTSQFYGQTLTPQQFLANPAAQDAVFQGQFGSYANKYGMSGASEAWFGGPGSVGKTGRTDILGTSVGGYSNQFEKLYAEAATAAPAVDELSKSVSTLKPPIDSVIPSLQNMANTILNFAPGGIPISSQAASAITSGFGGLFAEGGTLGAGNWGIAGEHGPEIIHGPASVTPMQRGGASKFNVNIRTQEGVTARVTNAQQNEEGDFDLEIFAEAIERRVRDKYGLRAPVSRWGRA